MEEEGPDEMEVAAQKNEKAEENESKKNLILFLKMNIRTIDRTIAEVGDYEGDVSAFILPLSRKTSAGIILFKNEGNGLEYLISEDNLRVSVFYSAERKQLYAKKRVPKIKERIESKVERMLDDYIRNATVDFERNIALTTLLAGGVGAFAYASSNPFVYAAFIAGLGTYGKIFVDEVSKLAGKKKRASRMSDVLASRVEYHLIPSEEIGEIERAYAAGADLNSALLKASTNMKEGAATLLRNVAEHKWDVDKKLADFYRSISL